MADPHAHGEDDAAMSRDKLIAMLRGIDQCYLSTVSPDGRPHVRPMSNNGQVEWDGTNWFFSNGDTRKVADIETTPDVVLTFEADATWIVLTGTATLHRDKALFEAHWTPDIDRWFEDGIDTPGLVMIEVRADRAEAWGKEGSGVVEL